MHAHDSHIDNRINYGALFIFRFLSKKKLLQVGNDYLEKKAIIIFLATAPYPQIIRHKAETGRALLGSILNNAHERKHELFSMVVQKDKKK
mgnify:CR=1 FL=1